MREKRVLKDDVLRFMKFTDILQDLEKHAEIAEPVIRVQTACPGTGVSANDFIFINDK
jgi:hypothetical protein